MPAAGGRKPPATQGTEFFSIEECARFFAVSTQVIHRWRGAGLFAEFGALFLLPGGPHRQIVRFHRGACEKMRASFAAQPTTTYHSSSRPQRNIPRRTAERF